MHVYSWKSACMLQAVDVLDQGFLNKLEIYTFMCVKAGLDGKAMWM